MPITVLKTDGGPHSAEQWAVVTASHLVESAGAQSEEGLRFTADLIKLLKDAHGEVQKDGRAALGKKKPFDCVARSAGYVDPTLTEILKLSADTPFAEHFHKQETQDYICQVLHKHFATALDIEHKWHNHRSAA